MEGHVGGQCVKVLCACLAWVVDVLTVGVVIHQLLDLDIAQTNHYVNCNTNSQSKSITTSAY